VALIAFWCLKLFGGNWFEIVVENENFIKFCNYAENSWIQYVTSLFSIFFSNFFMFCAIKQEFLPRGKSLLAIFLLILSMWFVVKFIPHFLEMQFWYGYVVIIVYGLLVQKGIKRLFGVLGVILSFAFSTISILVRNLPLEITYNYLIGNILMIDIYLMYILHYLYSNLSKLKEKEMAQFLGYGWLGKEDAQVRGYDSWRRLWHNVGYALSFKWAKKR
jgi:hypothetical protein